MSTGQETIAALELCREEVQAESLIKPLNQKCNEVHVCAIIVTYQPDLDALRKLIVSLRPQLREIIVVDNGSSKDLRAWIVEQADPMLRLIQLMVNTGVGHAQNRGIEYAMKLGSSHVLLMDQDSLPAANMVESLLCVALEYSNIGAVGPYYQDLRQRYTSPFIEVRGFRLIRHFPAPGKVSVPVDYLISSGSLIPIEVIKKMGGMREDLFIDYIDIEWGLRAKTFGMQCRGVFAARMIHNLGEAPIEWCGRSIPIHSALRHYYIMRNAILLYKEKNIPLHWKFVDASRLALKFGFYSIFTRKPLTHCRMMTLGLWHGLVGRGGPYPA